MTFQFHTTTFGQIIRLLSRNKVFQYPDEIDPLLWKRFLRQDASEHINGSSESSSKKEATENGAPENGVLHNDEPDILLVEWYGPDDPEVSHFTSSPYEVHPHHYAALIQALRVAESSELASKMEESHDISTLRPQFCSLHGKLHLCTR